MSWGGGHLIGSYLIMGCVTFGFDTFDFVSLGSIMFWNVNFSLVSLMRLKMGLGRVQIRVD